MYIYRAAHVSRNHLHLMHNAQTRSEAVFNAVLSPYEWRVAWTVRLSELTGPIVKRRSPSCDQNAFRVTNPLSRVGSLRHINSTLYTITLLLSCHENDFKIRILSLVSNS